MGLKFITDFLTKQFHEIAPMIVYCKYSFHAKYHEYLKYIIISFYLEVLK